MEMWNGHGTLNMIKPQKCSHHLYVYAYAFVIYTSYEIQHRILHTYDVWPLRVSTCGDLVYSD